MAEKVSNQISLIIGKLKLKVSISSKQHHHSNFNLTLLDVVDALCPAAPALDPPLDFVFQHRNTSVGFRLFKLDLRRGGESSHLDDEWSWWDLWEHVKNNSPLKPNDNIHTVLAWKWHTISNSDKRWVADVPQHWVLHFFERSKPLKPVRMATLAVYWWVNRHPTLLLCYHRFLFTHFDALNEKPCCDQPYAALWEDSVSCS